MPWNPADKRSADAAQQGAAHDPSTRVRLVAGPGTGKSATIGERVRWLLARASNQVPPDELHVVSFTRAAARDLEGRIHRYCQSHGQHSGTQVRVTTLHSLALRILRRAGALGSYPADPRVLDQWELTNVFEAEFGKSAGVSSIKRRREIRLHHEAFWSTGQWNPANYIPPDPPITQSESTRFGAFHRSRAQVYACVLPGEIVRECVLRMRNGTLNAVEMLSLRHIIVDEYQDLNPMDLEFVDQLAAQGAEVFVAGDDDQSIYSFRFASPAGIQDFTTKYPACGRRVLAHCFRCAPSVLSAAEALIASNAPPARIPKTYASMLGSASPAVGGVVWRWRFESGRTESSAVAESCRDLIQAGVDPRRVLVLLSDTRTLLPGIGSALDSVGVAYEPPRTEGFLDAPAGRWALAASRIVCDTDDYVAHRDLLGLRTGYGVGTCDGVAQAVLANSLNFRDLFYGPLPPGAITGRGLSAVNAARAVCARLQGWQATDTLSQRGAAIGVEIGAALGSSADLSWQQYVAALPGDMTVAELRDYLWADTAVQQSEVLRSVFVRLGRAAPASAGGPHRVRVMTMHGAKGLDADVVFIPGLEEDLLPGPRRRPYAGLVLESARLLYVSITRARVACVVSFARGRVVHGRFVRGRTASRFCTDIPGPFIGRTSGLTTADCRRIHGEISQVPA